MAAKKTAKSATKSAAKKTPAKKAASKTAKRPAAAESAAVDAAPAEAAGAAAPPKPKSPGSAKPVRPPLESVARAAYLIYRRRVELGLPGDSHGDWLQAERELAGSAVEP